MRSLTLTALMAGAVLAAVTAGTRADKEKSKPVKADVVIKQDQKRGDAKVGQTVEVRINNPVVRDRVADLKVTVTGEALDPKYRVLDTVPTAPDGKPLIGGGFKSIYVKVKEKGSGRVKVEYKKGDEKHSHEYEIEGR